MVRQKIDYWFLTSNMTVKNFQLKNSKYCSNKSNIRLFVISQMFEHFTLYWNIGIISEIPMRSRPNIQRSAPISGIIQYSLGLFNNSFDRNDLFHNHMRSNMFLINSNNLTKVLEEILKNCSIFQKKIIM